MRVINFLSCCFIFATLVCLLLFLPSDVMAQKGELPMTTSSDEARDCLIKGRDVLEKFYYEDAKKYLEKAVELDPEFALAHLWLGRTYGFLRETKAQRDAYEKALKFSENATKQEKLYIQAVYANIIEGDQEKRCRILKKTVETFPNLKRVHSELASYYNGRDMSDKAIEAYKKAIEIDPSYGYAINNLAYTYANIGEYDKAIECLKRYASVSPGDANPLDSMGEIYFKMGKLDDAIAKYKETLKIKPDFGSEWQIAYIYALKEDYTEAMKWIDQDIEVVQSSGQKAEGFMWKGLYYYWLGNRDRSLSELDRSTDRWKEVGQEYRIAFTDWMKGWIYYDRGEFEVGWKYFENRLHVFLKYLPQFTPVFTAEYNFNLGLLDLKQGRIDSAKFRLTEIKSLLTETVPIGWKDWMRSRYDLLYGEVLLAEKSVKEAIAVGKKASPLGIPGITDPGEPLWRNVPFQKDVLARAYLQKGELDKAIAEYERLITFDPDRKERCLIHPKYHYQLAKLYEQKGWSNKAIEQYEKFLKIWKDADKDLVELNDANDRLVKLKEGN